MEKEGGRGLQEEREMGREASREYLGEGGSLCVL